MSLHLPSIWVFEKQQLSLLHVPLGSFSAQADCVTHVGHHICATIQLLPHSECKCSWTADFPCQTLYGCITHIIVVLGMSFCEQIKNFTIYVHWQLFQSFLKGMLDILLSFRHTVLGHSIPTDMFMPKEGQSRVNSCQKVCALKGCSDYSLVSTCTCVCICSCIMPTKWQPYPLPVTVLVVAR